MSVAIAPTAATPAEGPAAHRAIELAGDLRIHLFAILVAIGTVHHELQFILEQQRTGPFADYLERWTRIKPSIGWSSEVGVALHLADLLIAILILVSPWRRALLIPLAGSFLLVNLVSPERIPSHNSLLVGALALVAIFAMAEIVERLARPGRLTTDWYGWTLTGLMSLCVLTYLFAAFQKLNSTFFSLAESTAPPFAVHFAALAGIPATTALPLLGYPTIYGTVAIEAALPILLIRRRTRLLGCLLGALFHLAMMARGIFDFPAMILGFYPLFMSLGEARSLVARLRARPSVWRLLGTIALSIVGAAALATSEYLEDLYGAANGAPSAVALVHTVLLHVTLTFFAYVTATVGGLLLRGGVRPDE